MYLSKRLLLKVMTDYIDDSKQQLALSVDFFRWIATSAPTSATSGILSVARSPPLVQSSKIHIGPFTSVPLASTGHDHDSNTGDFQTYRQQINNVGMLGFDMMPFLSTPIFYVRQCIVQFVKDHHHGMFQWRGWRREMQETTRQKSPVCKTFAASVYSKYCRRLWKASFDCGHYSRAQRKKVVAVGCAAVMVRVASSLSLFSGSMCDDRPTHSIVWKQQKAFMTKRRVQNSSE